MGRSRSRSPLRRERRRSRSASRDRERRRRERERSRSRERDRRRSRSRSPHRRRSRSPRRHRSSSLSPTRQKERREEEKKEVKEKVVREHQISEEEMQGKTEEEIEMLKMMGFSTFDSTKVNSASVMVTGTDVAILLFFIYTFCQVACSFDCSSCSSLTHQKMAMMPMLLIIVSASCFLCFTPNRERKSTDQSMHMQSTCVRRENTGST
uniref:Uncharacterized protein n=1 Tax=Paramormyrops kingsleyae TaxID=1676925 RepID=A0A3B3R885_9TELE